jgi:hypothetical protein
MTSGCGAIFHELRLKLLQLGKPWTHHAYGTSATCNYKLPRCLHTSMPCWTQYVTCDLAADWYSGRVNVSVRGCDECRHAIWTENIVDVAERHNSEWH